MYCDLNDAYRDTYDLTQSREDCVYDNIVNDKSVCFPRNMFSAQGEYSSVEEPKIPPTIEIEQSLASEEKKEDVLMAGTPINALKNISETQKDTSCKIGTTSDIKKIPKKYSKKSSNVLTLDEEDHPRYQIREGFSKNFMNDLKDGIFITLIGIMVLFLLDILARISRKL